MNRQSAHQVGFENRLEELTHPTKSSGVTPEQVIPLIGTPALAELGKLLRQREVRQRGLKVLAGLGAAGGTALAGHALLKKEAGMAAKLPTFLNAAKGVGAADFEKRLAELTHSAKSAGFLRGLLGRGAGKVKLPGLSGAIEKATLEQQLAKRQIQTAAQQSRLGAPAVPNKILTKPPVAPPAPPAPTVPRPRKPAAKGLGAKAKNVVGQAASGIAGSGAAQAAQKALGNLSQTVGGRVGGMQPGLLRRALAGPEHASSSPLNPADLGKKVLGRAGTAGLGAGVAGGAYMKGEADAAAEAKRRASEMGFMQRLAFLMNPDMVNRM